MLQTISQRTDFSTFSTFDGAVVKGIDDSEEISKYASADLEVFGQLSVSLRMQSQDQSVRFWWQATALPLAILLSKANYSKNAQYRHLMFYVSCVIPVMGLASTVETPKLQWHSFMTDDGTPVELSLDWGWNWKSPSKLPPETNLEWFNHFADEFLVFEPGVPIKDEEVHESRFFAAYDTNENDVAVKAYFLPAFRAKQEGQTKLQAITNAIIRLPGYESSAYTSFHMLREYMENTPAQHSLEAEIFAVDCMLPQESRLKIYVRSRSTSFDTMKATMSLGGRFCDPKMEEGLTELRELMRLVLGLGTDNYPDHLQLPETKHRTGGVLYYFEIRPGKMSLLPKVYIPVRHYARSDHHILEGLGQYLSARKQGQAMNAFRQAMLSSFTPKGLRETTGVQTYIGCTIKDGSLKLISYINPEVSRFLKNL